MKVAIVGTGYVGLVTGTCFAEVGMDVTCIDIDQKKIDNLHKGILPIYEPGLDEMVKRNVEKKRLHFSTSLKDSIQGAEVVFIAVGTPPDEDGSADLKYVLAVAASVGEHMQHPLVIVTKSTVPVSTAEKVRKSLAEQLAKRGSNLDFYVASNPEFLKEGAAIDDFMKPDRIVVGVDRPEAEDLMRKLYKPFLMNGHPIYFMDIPSAEMTKYAANAMLATKISFMNDIANLCEIMGADVNMVRKGIGSDTRIGTKFIYPGVGYGGSCFPKDVKALIKSGKEENFDFKILEATEYINKKQKVILVDEIEKYFGGNIEGKKIAMWGLAFKANTDDIREASSLDNIELLLEKGAQVVAYDAIAEENVRKILGDKIEYAKDMYSALEGADCLLIATEWSEFKNPNFELMASKLKNKVIFDGRNMFSMEQAEGSGFFYKSIGRKTVR